MKLIKQIAPAQNGFIAQTKEAFIAQTKNGKSLVTVMQTNSNGLDCQWETTDTETVVNSFLSNGYEVAA